MAEWTASLLPLLPLDVLHLVGLVAHPSDLCSMLLVNKALNKTLTPVLYSNIELDAWDPILKCIETLSTPSKQRSFGRMLEKQVRSLVIKRPVTRKPSYASGGVGDALFKALPLMVNLKHFSSGVALSPCSSNIFYLLATGSCPSLQSMELQVLGEVPTALEGKHPNEIESSLSPFQAPPRVNLRRLALELPVGSAAQRSFVRHLLRTCAPTLRSLSLTLDGRYVTGIWEHFLPPDAHFARLEDLATDFEALSAHPPFQRADTVRSLTVSRSPGGGRGGGSLGTDVLPDLRTLSCPAKLLSAFLPAGDGHRRPIATVRLGKASYQSYENDGSQWPHGRELSTWRDVFGALQHLRYSAVPVISLTVDVASIPVAGVQAAQPYLASLEHLDVVLHRAYEVVRDSYIVICRSRIQTEKMMRIRAGLDVHARDRAARPPPAPAHAAHLAPTTNQNVRPLPRRRGALVRRIDVALAEGHPRTRRQAVRAAEARVLGRHRVAQDG